jgi:hypothetical protein
MLIKLKAGQIIRLLNYIKGTITLAEYIYLGLAEVFQGMPLIVEELEERVPNSFLFFVALYNDKLFPDFSKADIGIY